jgi:hypothetical protein
MRFLVDSVFRGVFQGDEIYRKCGVNLYRYTCNYQSIILYQIHDFVFLFLLPILDG